MTKSRISRRSTFLTNPMRALTILSLFTVGSSALAQSATSDRNTSTTSTVTERPARAPIGVFIEPLILGSVAATEIKTSQLPLIGDDTSGRLESAGLGLRAGGHLGEMIFLAADARYNRSRFMDSSYDKADGAGYNYGGTLGVQAPFAGLRVWGTRVFGGEMDPTAGRNGFDVKFSNARGYRIGAGLRFAAVSVNLEHEDLTYGNTDIQSVGSIAADTSTSVDFTQRGTILSLSFPVEL